MPDGKAVDRWAFGILVLDLMTADHFSRQVKNDDGLDFWRGVYPPLFGSLQISKDRLFLGDDQITFLVVHVGGFLLDLSVGFLLVLDSTRWAAFFLCGLFNAMNSRMFAIGMFPYVMIAVMPIFCSADWPKKLLSCLPQRMRSKIAYDSTPGRSDNCIYVDKETSKPPVRPGLRHHVTSACVVAYFLVQAVLPYSHPLTPGYNGWTDGPYGYSWDMMVHNWRHVHTTLTVVDRDTGHTHHLDPKALTQSHRWSHHADMVKQLAECVKGRMAEKHGMKDVEVYVDVWISLNRRFTQRMYDPTVDVSRARWSPFEEVTWLLPLQTHLTHWRRDLVIQEEHIFETAHTADVLFVTDFPGFHLLNYVADGQSNTTLRVMQGSVEVRFERGHAALLQEGDSTGIPSGSYHQVSPLKHRPACYMYLYHANRTEEGPDSFLQAATCPAEPQQEAVSCEGVFCWARLKRDLGNKIAMITRSATLIGRALHSIVTQTPMKVEIGQFQHED